MGCKHGRLKGVESKIKKNKRIKGTCAPRMRVEGKVPPRFLASVTNWRMVQCAQIQDSGGAGLKYKHNRSDLAFTIGDASGAI